MNPFLRTALLALSVAISVTGFASQTTKPFVIVSDIDDTVKHTHVMKPLQAVKNGFTGKKAFLGMAELYRAMIARTGLSNSAEDRAMVFLSASPTILRKALWNQLVEINQFPPARFILRHWVAQYSTHDYKIGALNNVAHRTPHPMILVGDDTEHDPEIFLEFAHGQPSGKAAAVYIRRNIMRALPEGATGIFSAFDMALYELEAGRILPEDVVAVGERIVTAGRPDLLFPSFSFCPTLELWDMPVGEVAASHPEVMEMKARVDAYILDVCSER